VIRCPASGREFNLSEQSSKLSESRQSTLKATSLLEFVTTRPYN
jgi:hypothetical protein